MNILFLSNSARGYYRFFNALAREFVSDGHGIVIAADSSYSSYINHLEELDVPVHVFSDFFAKHEYSKSLLTEYAAFNLNAALLPDFERAQLYRIWKRHDDGYFDALKSALLAFFTEIVRQHAIECVIFENVSDAFSYTAFYVCQHLGIRYCGISGSRLPGRFTLTESPFGESRSVERNLDAINDGSLQVAKDTERWCADYLKNIDTITPDYMRFNNLDKTRLLSRYTTGDKLRVIAGSFRHLFDRHEYAFKIGNPLKRRWNIFTLALARKIRVRKLHRYYRDPDLEESFLLYPLHYHPESSTSVLAGTYLDEYEVIRNIAFNLPEGVRLYVKDHISGFGQATSAFYESIVRLPNVTLLSPWQPTKELIRRSLAVITLTSTVGYEALLLGRRVFLFGRVFYEFHPDVVRVTNPAALFDLFAAWLHRPLHSNREYNLRFVEAYYHSTLPGVFDPAGPGAPELAKAVYPCILKAIRTPDSTGYSQTTES